MKLAAPALGVVLIALSLLVPVVPKPASPGLVDEVKLQPPPGGKQRAAARLASVTPDRRSPRDDRLSRETARAAAAKASPNARSISTAGGVRRPDATPPSPLPAADSPTGQPRNDSAPRAGGSPTPRTTPVRVKPPAPDRSAPQRDPASVPSEPADRPDVDATTAGADPPDEPEGAGDDPLIETP